VFSRRLRPADPDDAASTDIARTRLREAAVMDPWDNARAEELNNLRLALATFALQLDVFEMRMTGGPSRTAIKRESSALPADLGRDVREENRGARR
jgi:hypothetical protein